MKPMLAKNYYKQLKKLEYPLYCQPKLNGVRALYWSTTMQSRDEIFWDPSVLTHITKDLEACPGNYILDGELYVHGWSLQKINSACSVVRREPVKQTAKVKYHVFDCVITDALDAPFSVRQAYLSELFPNFGPSIIRVETRLMQNKQDADQWYAKLRRDSYEGMMYRFDVPYGLEHHCSNQENRWPCLLKRKEWLDEDCPIIDVEVGEGRFSDCVGSLVLTFPQNGQRFTAGSGLTDVQRHIFMDRPPIGGTAKIKYEMLSDTGVPLKPTVILVTT